MATKKNEILADEERKTTEIPLELHGRFKSEAALRGLTLIEANTEAIELWMRTKPDSRKKSCNS
jgi:hypothetical protein